MEPEAGQVVGVIGPPTARPDLAEPDELKDLLQRIRDMIDEAILNAVGDVRTDILNELLFEIDNSINNLDLRQWINLFLLKQTRYSRSAKIQAGGVPSNSTGPFTCKLLDADGLEVGNTIEVYPREPDSFANNLDSGDVYPSYSAADDISVYLDLDGVWYAQDFFEDTIDCDCYSAP